MCAAPAHCLNQQLTSTEVHALHALGVSIGAYATVYIAITSLSVLIWVLLGALLFWRRSDEPMALFCSFMLVLFGGASHYLTCSKRVLPPSRSAGMCWSMSCGFSARCPLSSSFTSSRPVALCPAGRAGRFCSWQGTTVWEILTDNTRQFTPLSALVFFGLILTTVVAQVYRYRRVSTLSQRQQTKWVVFAFVLFIVGFIGLYGAGQLIIPIFAPQWYSSSVVGFLIGLAAQYGDQYDVPADPVFDCHRHPALPAVGH